MKGQDLLLLLKLVSLARAEARPLAARDDRAGLAGRVAEVPSVEFRPKLTQGGCGKFLGLIYVTKPKLSRYSMGLR